MRCAVSQFTLYGILKGNKPDFHAAMSPDRAKPFYNSVVERFGKAYRTDAVKGIDFSFLVSDLECMFLFKAPGIGTLGTETSIFYICLGS